MANVITGNSYISILRIQAIFDISGTTPLVLLTNLSEGNNLSQMTYWWVIKSPTTTIIHEGSANDPDETGIWSEAIDSSPWPRPNNQIEWSGPPYTFQPFAQDPDGNIFEGEIQNATICRPNGNLPDSKNTYGLGDVTIQTLCDQARIYFQDVTNTSYKGLTGTIGSSVLRVNYPMDDTGVVPSPFVGDHFSTAMVPVTFSGKGYQFLYTSIYQYELEEDTYVRIKYLLNDTFGVWCNVDLMPLVCEFEKLGASLSDGSCSDIQSAQNKMNLISPLMFRVFIGIAQPRTGVDVSAVIEKIKNIGEFDCDCCNAATGIVPTGSSAFDGYTFQIVSEGGDIGGTVGGSGFNIQFLLHDVKYIVSVCDSSPSETTAFQFIPSLSGDGYTKTYCLKVDITQFGYDLATDISANPDLLNFWQQLFLNNGGTWTLLVDGGCIFDTSDACDYSFTLSNIPVSTTFALITGIKVGNTNVPLSFSLNLTNIGAFQTYLNSLGYGNFVVTNPSGQTVLVESTANTNSLDNLTYKISVSNYIASLTKDCTGYVPLSANEVVQNIINWACNLDDIKLVTSQDYEICYIDPATQIKTISTVSSATALSDFIIELLAKGCDTIDYIVSLGSLDCASIKNKFPYMAQAMQPNDIFLVTKNGACSQATPNEIFLTLLTYGAFNTDVKEAFCAFVNSCTGTPCTAYDEFYVTVEEGSPLSIQDLVVTFSNPDTDIVSHTIRYARIDNTTSPQYITITGIGVGASPYTISGVETGQYRVYIQPVYADGRKCQEIFYTTPACTGLNALSAVYDGATINVTYSLNVLVLQIKIIVNYPNGGQATYIYNNGDTIEITPPTDVFGVFQITAQGVCNEDTGFFSIAAAPVSVTVNPTNNSSIENATNASNFTIQVLADSNTIVALSSLSVAQTIDFYLDDGTYSNIQVRGVATGYSVSLTTGTGTYYAIYGGGGKWDFSGIPVLDGVVITIIDDSSPPSYTFIVTNNATAPITGISPAFYLISEGSFPLTTGQSANGVQGGYSGVISVEESGLIGDWHATLYINSVEIECLFSTGGTQSFSSQTFVAGDEVEIVITDGAC